MRILKKLAAAGAGTGLFAASIVAIPFGGAVSAASVSTNDFGTNKAVDVQTELDCNTHTLTAKVTNKTAGDITPNVTFDQLPPSLPSNMPIKPNDTGYYFYNYSGNNHRLMLKVAVDTFDPLKMDPMLRCNEPVSFTATDASQSAVAGILTNNSSMVAQVALTQAMSGDVHVESLEPNEARFVAMPFTGYPDQQMAFVSVGTTSGFQTSYTIDLNQPVIPPSPPVALPIPKD